MDEKKGFYAVFDEDKCMIFKTKTRSCLFVKMIENKMFLGDSEHSTNAMMENDDLCLRIKYAVT